MVNGNDKLTLETNSVALQAVHGLLEKSLSGGGHTRDVVLVPLNGGIDVLEDLLDRICNFCADSVSGDEGNLLLVIRACSEQSIRYIRTVYTPPYLVEG